MFLKSLTMKGFKSFADTTGLDFEPGVTVVVGPNGSGKSNVVDAIAWVLGAQGPRTVRSQKMEDVVFAGTAKRAALGRAEVSLVLDNSSGILPVDFTEVTISRTLFRNGDSEYSLNGVACRLLDIQELLSDAGVGRQQHIIIAQGQIDQVLNARPEDRRSIIEEAAGILKFRRRKERAERRLLATERNVERLEDLQREIRRQLRPLERQADAARRHESVVSELRALQLHLAGRELAELRTRLRAAHVQRTGLATEESEVRSELARVDTAVMAAESRLAAAGDDLGDTLPRYEALAQRCRGLGALLAERRRSLERDRGSLLAEDVVAAMEAESADLEAKLTEVAAAAAALAPEAEALAATEVALEAEIAEFEAAGETTEFSQSAAPVTPAAEVRGELTALRKTLERTRAERERTAARLEALAGRSVEAGEKARLLRERLEILAAGEESLVAKVDAAQADTAGASVALEEAIDTVRRAEADRARWKARVEALGLALAETHAQAGLEKLTDLEGVMGTLADVVDVDEGWELAFEAAVGDAITSVIVDGPAGAARALERLADEGGGSVLPAHLGEAQAGPAANTAALPGSCVSLSEHVRPRNASVQPLLNRLIGSAVVASGGWHSALDVALALGGEGVVVTREGDRFGDGGWRIGAAGSGATLAAYEEAQSELEDSTKRVEAAREAEKVARNTVAVARGREKEAVAALDSLDTALTTAGEELARVEAGREQAAAEAVDLEARLEELTVPLERDASRVGELEALLPSLEAAEAARRRAREDREQARRELDERSRALEALKADLGVRAATLEERRAVLLRRRDEVAQRLARHAGELQAAAGRRRLLDARLGAVDRLARFVARRGALVDTELSRLRARRERQSAATRAVAAELDAHRARRSELDRRLNEIRELLGRSDVEEAELKLRIETLVDRIRGELDAEPEVALATALPPLEEGVTPRARVRELEGEIRRMGPINPLALQEFEELDERHRFVSHQLQDVRKGRRELNKIIRAVDDEIVAVFAAAFADVSENFEKLFSTLFPGGKGSLQLTDPDDLLATGVELEARPSGKNVRKLSLLSGGERSLTALAFLFAIFRSRPSPFYVMDEVEAALDDVNLHRFLDLVAEFRQEAQLVIVSHQKRTMEAADCLYGVTMAPGGSSRVVSEKVA